MRDIFCAGVLKWILINNGIKQVEFAMASGLPPCTVSGILNGWLKAGPKTKQKVINGMIKLNLIDPCVKSEEFFGNQEPN